MSCTPGMIFGALSVMSVVSSAFISWRAFVVDLTFHLLIMLGVFQLCKGHHMKTLWWLLVILVGLPVFLLMTGIATGACDSCSVKAIADQAGS
jgi:multisubunit Na+/H+ antiporter MnhC subunit